MDRLTKYISMQMSGKHKGASLWSSTLVHEAYARLAAYEDTGLMPEEVAALKAENERLRVLAEEQTPCEIIDYIDESYERHIECPICGCDQLREMCEAEARLGEGKE